MPEKLMRQKDAAAMLGVSISYLRASDCPKVLLPPSRGKRPLVRYRESELMAWAEKWTVRSTMQLRKAS